MNGMPVNAFLWGGSAVASAAVALFCLRFWRDTSDRFFLAFASAFGVLAANWLGLAVTNPADEGRTYSYLARLLAFLLIILAIVDKNRSGAGKDRSRM